MGALVYVFRDAVGGYSPHAMDVDNVCVCAHCVFSFDGCLLSVFVWG